MTAVSLTPEHGEDEDEDLLDGEPVSAEEAERLIFGGKDFTQGKREDVHREDLLTTRCSLPIGSSVVLDKATEEKACAAALAALGLDGETLLVVMKLWRNGKVPSDPDFLIEKVALNNSSNPPWVLEQ